MSVKRYYRFALGLPLLVPLLAWPLTLLNGTPPMLGLVAYFLFWSVVLGGVPYLLFVTGMLLWMRRAPDRHVRVAILAAPLLYMAVLLPCLAAVFVVDGTLARSGDSLGAIATYALVLGYAYVLIAELGRLILLRPPSAASAVAA